MKISTDKQAKYATSGGKPRIDIPVSGVEGLVLRVTSAGHKSWAMRYYVSAGTKPMGAKGQDAAGQPASNTQWERRRITLGDYASTPLKTARDRARAARREVELGNDPARKKQTDRQAVTFGGLFDYWYERHAERKLDTADFEKRRFERHMASRIGSVTAAKLKRQHVAGVRDDVAVCAGPVESNRVLALINRVLNFAVDEELIEVNVAARMRKAGDEKPRTRVLSDEELIRLWTELDRCERWQPKPGTGAMGRPMPLAMVRAIRLLILLGQRRTEVIGAAVSELKLDSEPVWTVPAGRTKNGELHRVPLPPMAVFEYRRALAEAFAESGQKSGQTAFVFPSAKVDGQHIRGDAVTKALQRVCRRIGIEGVGPHDLRRTVGTGLAKLRVTPDIRSLVLNHVRGRRASETTRVYDQHGYDDEKLEALLKWENHVRNTVGAWADLM